MKLLKCCECDRPVAPYTSCPWCGTLVLPNSNHLVSVAFFSVIAIIFTILSCYIQVPPPQNNTLSISLGFALGAIAALLFRIKYPLLGLLPISAIYTAFLKISLCRAICIHTPYIIFLFIFSLAINSLKQKTLPSGSLIKRILSSNIIVWAPLLVLACLYTSAQGAFLIPAVIAVAALFFVTLQNKPTEISLITVAILSGFAHLYFNFLAFFIGFIFIAIGRIAFNHFKKETINK